MCFFYLGTHIPSWLGTTAIPLFISRRRLTGRRTLPRAIGRWALDSGGFSELSIHGRWTVTAETYVTEANRYFDEIGNMDWLAIMDWMCEPWVLNKTGLTVREHQARTVDSYLRLRDAAPHLPWVPVLQGWEGDDYLRHIDRYDEAGVVLYDLPLVGLGSVCRRQHTSEIEALIKELRPIPLHGFGFKIKGLQNVATRLVSADSMAWSLDARYNAPLAGCLHKNCANCLRYASRWYDRIIGLIEKEKGIVN